MPTDAKGVVMPRRRAGRFKYAALCLGILLCCKFAFFGGPGVLVVTPSQVNACDTLPQVVQVWWWAPLSRDGVRLYLTGLGGPATLWIEGATRGNATTGAWISEGATFILMDRHGHTLWRQTMTAWQCSATPSR